MYFNIKYIDVEDYTDSEEDAGMIYTLHEGVEAVEEGADAEYLEFTDTDNEADVQLAVEEHHAIDPVSSAPLKRKIPHNFDYS